MTGPLQGWTVAARVVWRTLGVQACIVFSGPAVLAQEEVVLLPPYEVWAASDDGRTRSESYCGPCVHRHVVPVLDGGVVALHWQPPRSPEPTAVRWVGVRPPCSPKFGRRGGLTNRGETSDKALRGGDNSRPRK